MYLRHRDQIIGWELTNLEDEISETTLDKPNPLTLVVELDKKGNLSLNSENHGNVSDLVSLENRLKEVFEARQQSRAELQKLTSQSLTKVYLQVPAETTPFDENMKRVIDSLKKVGAEPIKISIKANEKLSKTNFKSFFTIMPKMIAICSE